MTLYDPDNEQHLEYLARHKRRGDEITAMFDARDKAEDPLAFYWKKGVQAMRRDHKLLGFFIPKPEQFYNEGAYDD